MPTNTYTALDQKVITGSPAASITFTSIPSGYTDLIMVADIAMSSPTGTVYIVGQVGNATVDTGTNYSFTAVVGNGSTVSSYRNSNQTYFQCDTYLTGTNRAIIELQLQSYSNTSINKVILGRTSGPGQSASAYVNLWRSTAAINTLKLYDYTGNSFAIGSTFTLYGIASSDIPAYATGGFVSQDSTYWYHAFPMSGTFTPKQALTADILVVAGGGGSGGGGAGAGGVFAATAQSLTSGTAYTCTVGAGGAAGAGTSSGGTNGTSGGNSTFGALTAAVGGGYSTGTDGTGVSGGSGSGASPSSGAVRSGGASTQTGTGGTGYGNAGGSNGFTASPYTGGGGGGSGTAGGSATSSTVAGVGGNGSNTWSAWLSATGYGVNGYLAGGGGGAVFGGGGTAGAGGLGGGGNGGNGVAGVDGVIATGAGGGGGGNAAGGKGGSGLIIVRYAK